MPYGKGTYGTKRGRPPVKKKVKKLAQGGRAGVDYNPSKPSGGDKSLINEGMFSKLKRKIKNISASPPIQRGAGKAYDRLTNERMKIRRALRGPGLTAAERKELRKLESAKYDAQFGKSKVKGSKTLGVYDQYRKQEREDQASRRKADARIKAKENLKGIKKLKHGGKVGKCPRDGIAMRGKTRG
tara:strand:+ start:28 stop:582 length:555 start_codon:yes stop_codon:yes gene_type:complete